ncbi:Chromate transport protein [bacterium HR40]|nr:Chromate transport protein [bacterium HR40]
MTGATPRRPGRPGEVLAVFFGLGLRSFGGPVAHMGYFHDTFVRRRAWLDDATFAQFMALSQMLPGPASSQVGMAIGLLRAGPVGAVCAWLGFTLPSALAMLLLGLGISLASPETLAPWLDGFEIAAFAIVAEAVWLMARSGCRDRLHILLALAALACVLLLPGVTGQIAAILLGAGVGALFTGDSPWDTDRPLAPPLGRHFAFALLVLFALLLLLLPLAARSAGWPLLALFDAFFRAGSLIFGGGHVVLPLLQGEIVGRGWVAPELFVAGYGAAQAVPGPLLSFAAYLGAVARPAGGVGGGIVALVAIFLPSLLLVLGTVPFLAELRRQPLVGRALSGVNAAVVGLLLAALYDPVWQHAVEDRTDFVLAATAFAARRFFAAPTLALVAACALAGALRGAF